MARFDECPIDDPIDESPCIQIILVTGDELAAAQVGEYDPFGAFADRDAYPGSG